MKDYRLSEIKNHDWREGWQVDDDYNTGYQEEQFLEHLQIELQINGVYPEPRDMIELPCKECRVDEYGNIYWDVYFRNKKRGYVDNLSFWNEADADAFLAELRRKYDIEDATRAK